MRTPSLAPFAGLFLCACAASDVTPTPPAPDTSGAPPLLPLMTAVVPSAYVTTSDLAQRLAPVAVQTDAAGNADVTVTVDPTTTYQPIVGFGASITDSASYVMTHDQSPTQRRELLTALFDPHAGAGLTFLRQPMGASDFSSVGDFSYDDGTPDPSLTRFNLTQDEKATLPVLKAALAINPDLFILGTPWSAPAWMKANDSMKGSGATGGSSDLLLADYEAFADYFVKFVQAYAAQGVVVKAVTPQNEPRSGNQTFPSMSLDATSEQALIAQHLGPAFAGAGLATEIWAYDHNWDDQGYPAQILSDPTAAGYTQGAAFHCYAGTPSAMTNFHDAFPQTSVYMTECGGVLSEVDPFAATVDLLVQSTANWARAVSLWNMALDQNAGPQNDGCNACRSVVTVDSASGIVTYNAEYYALAHFARFVRPGAVRVASNTDDPSFLQVAFMDADGGMTVVAHNTRSEAAELQVASVVSGTTAMRVTVPSDAAVTLTWRGSSN